MKGLIIKDLLLIKGNLKNLLIIIVLFLLMSLSNINFSSFMLSFICIMMCMSTFSYDDYNKWNAYAMSLPKAKQIVVKSKYICTILIVIIATMLSVLLSILVASFSGTINISAILIESLACLSVIIIMMSIMYPVLYKFGTEKGRIIIFISILVCSFLLGLLFKLLETVHLDIAPFTRFLFYFKWVLIPFSLGLILWISYHISKKIFLQKEY